MKIMSLSILRIVMFKQRKQLWVFGVLLHLSNGSSTPIGLIRLVELYASEFSSAFTTYINMGRQFGFFVLTLLSGNQRNKDQLVEECLDKTWSNKVLHLLFLVANITTGAL